MAGNIIRPKDLPPRPSPVASELMIVDNGVTVGASTVQSIVEAGRPAASQAEAQTGTDAVKAMTPLTTKQSIASEVGVTIASKAQGALADTAVQSDDLAAVATSGDYGDLDNKPTLGTAAAADTGDFATAAQGATADSAVQPDDLAPVAVTGSYNDLIDKPTVIGTSVPFPQGCLSLVSGVATPTSDVAGATTIYFVASAGNQVPIYDGANFISRSFGAQISLPLDSNAAHTGYHNPAANFDLWAIWDGATVKLVTASWAIGGGSTGVRGTGVSSCELEAVGGLMVNRNSMTMRFGTGSADTVAVAARQATYLGSFAPTAAGQASDTRENRLLFNAYNRVLKPLRRADPANGWDYSATAYRQANANAANRVALMLGLPGVMVDLQHHALVQSSAASLVSLSIGLDGTTVPPGVLDGWAQSGPGYRGILANYHGQPGLGRRTLVMLERGGGPVTDSWLGSNAGTSVWQTGLSGSVLL